MPDIQLYKSIKPGNFNVVRRTAHLARVLLMPTLVVFTGDEIKPSSF